MREQWWSMVCHGGGVSLMTTLLLILELSKHILFVYLTITTLFYVFITKVVFDLIE